MRPNQDRPGSTVQWSKRKKKKRIHEQMFQNHWHDVSHHGLTHEQILDIQLFWIFSIDCSWLYFSLGNNFWILYIDWNSWIFNGCNLKAKIFPCENSLVYQPPTSRFILLMLLVTDLWAPHYKNSCDGRQYMFQFSTLNSIRHEIKLYPALKIMGGRRYMKKSSSLNLNMRELVPLFQSKISVPEKHP